MRRKAYIWRESVYKNGFRCSCGNVLFDGERVTNVIEDPFRPDEYLLCKNCKKAVVQITEIEAPADLEKMAGDYEEWLRSHRS